MPHADRGVLAAMLGVKGKTQFPARGTCGTKPQGVGENRGTGVPLEEGGGQGLTQSREVGGRGFMVWGCLQRAKWCVIPHQYEAARTGGTKEHSLTSWKGAE